MDLLEQYKIYTQAVEIDRNFVTSQFGKIQLTCSTCNLITNINGATSHYLKCKKIKEDKFVLIKKIFKLYDNCAFCNAILNYKGLHNNVRSRDIRITTCSNKCKRKIISFIYNYENNLQKCVICNKQYIGKYKTCSLDCSNQLRSDSNKDWYKLYKNTDLYISRNAKISESKIGKKLPFIVWNKGIKGETYLNHYEKNGKNTLHEALKKQKETWYKKTSIEEKIEKLLIKLGIPYQHCYFFAGTQFDFKINFNDVQTYIIETDGDYFHKSSRRCFDINERELKRYNDKLKENILYNKLGNDKCCIIRFWEYNINNNIDIIEDMLISMIIDEDKSSIINTIKQYYIDNQ